MKKNVKTIQSKSEKTEIEKPEVEIIPSEENEIPEVEIVPSEEIEIPEVEIIPSEENANENLDIEDDQEETQPDHIVEETASETEAKPEIKSVTENTEVSNKQKIKALKRTIDNKMYSIEREESKVKLWRIQAVDMDKKATDDYEKRKSELEILLKKNQERFDKRMAKTKKWWHEFSDNYTETKIKKLHDDLALLQSELLKFESLEPTEETK
jgi:hypothetical protein